MGYLSKSFTAFSGVSQLFAHGKDIFLRNDSLSYAMISISIGFVSDA
jgi:hypothetical protein